MVIVKLMDKLEKPKMYCFAFKPNACKNCKNGLEDDYFDQEYIDDSKNQYPQGMKNSYCKECKTIYLYLK